MKHSQSIDVSKTIFVKYSSLCDVTILTCLEMTTDLMACSHRKFGLKKFLFFYPFSCLKHLTSYYSFASLLPKENLKHLLSDHFINLKSKKLHKNYIGR